MAIQLPVESEKGMHSTKSQVIGTACLPKVFLISSFELCQLQIVDQ